MLTKFDSNDTIDIYIKNIITGYQINDGISNISNTNIFDYIIVITTESSIINISESNTIFLRNKMYLLNLNFNKIGLIHYRKAINFYQYIEKIFNKKKTITNTINICNYNSLEEYFVACYLVKIGIFV